MLKSQHFYPFVFILFFATNLSAQYEQAKHGLALRWNFINHEYPFTQELFGKNSHTYGAELSYLYHLHPNFNLAIPFKIGAADYYEMDDINSSNESISYQSLDALVHAKFFREPALISPYALLGFGINLEEFRDASFHIPFGAGINFRISKHLYLSAQTEYRHSFTDLRHGFRHGLGVFYILGNKKQKDFADRDGDGVADTHDECPDLAGLAMYAGCPDTDGDGVSDPKDLCPNTPGPKKHEGCPYGNDEDNDGILNHQDRCPNLPGTKRLDGCPDSDGDGIAEPDDDCPKQFGLAKHRGCPDTDDDGVPDPEDRCPNQTGLINNLGCPEIDASDQETLALAMNNVEFETSKALLKERSYITLQQIATLMKKYAGYHLSIVGHTDNVGDAQSNQSLSEKRAKACYQYLSKVGIDKKRMEYSGRGETAPIAPNTTMDGRQRNRRVEFTLFLK